MNEEAGRDPEQSAEPLEQEQETWTSPVRGIALGLALSLVLWVVIALLIRLLCEWWLASRLFRGALDAAEGLVATADGGPGRAAPADGAAPGGTRPSPRPA